MGLLSIGHSDGNFESRGVKQQKAEASTKSFISN